MKGGDKPRPGIVGRGAAANPKNRFEKIGAEPDPAETGDEPRPETVYLRDHSRSIIATNSDFGSRMKGGGVYAEHVSRLFGVACRRTGIERGRFPELSTASFRRDGGLQPGLFD